MARLRGLSAWAITDHDLLDASVHYADLPGAVIGCELTTWQEGREVHMVGLGMDPEHPALTNLLADTRAARKDYLQRICAHLRQIEGLEGVPDDAGEVPGSLIASRSHLAHWLVRAGHVHHHGAAFERWIADRHLRDMGPPDYPTLPAAAEAVRAAGGLTVLAHPAHYRDLSLIDRLLDTEALDAVETDHPGCDGHWKEQLKKAGRRGLVESCGSDFHFRGKRRLGDHCHRASYLQPLLKRLRHPAAASAPIGRRRRRYPRPAGRAPWRGHRHRQLPPRRPRHHPSGAARAASGRRGCRG